MDSQQTDESNPLAKLLQATSNSWFGETSTLSPSLSPSSSSSSTTARSPALNPGQYVIDDMKNRLNVPIIHSKTPPPSASPTPPPSEVVELPNKKIKSVQLKKTPHDKPLLQKFNSTNPPLSRPPQTPSPSPPPNSYNYNYKIAAHLKPKLILATCMLLAISVHVTLNPSSFGPARYAFMISLLGLVSLDSKLEGERGEKIVFILLTGALFFSTAVINYELLSFAMARWGRVGIISSSKFWSASTSAVTSCLTGVIAVSIAALICCERDLNIDKVIAEYEKKNK